MGNMGKRIHEKIDFLKRGKPTGALACLGIFNHLPKIVDEIFTEEGTNTPVSVPAPRPKRRLR
jgi:hypothetical protein